MANKVGWGQGSVNNDIGWGQGASNNEYRIGETYKLFRQVVKLI